MTFVWYDVLSVQAFFPQGYLQDEILDVRVTEKEVWVPLHVMQ